METAIVAIIPAGIALSDARRARRWAREAAAEAERLGDAYWQ